MAEERKPRTLTCRYHCAACGEHFTSLAAFDRHRGGDYETQRHCVPPAHVNADAADAGKGPRLVVQGTGECRLSGDPDVVITAIWEAA